MGKHYSLTAKTIERIIQGNASDSGLVSAERVAELHEQAESYLTRDLNSAVPSVQNGTDSDWTGDVIPDPLPNNNIKVGENQTKPMPRILGVFSYAELADLNITRLIKGAPK